MYTIYVNDRPLRLLTEPEAESPEHSSDSAPRTGAPAPPSTHLRARYIGKPRTLLNYVDTLEKGSPKVMSVDLISEDAEALWTDFRSHFKWVPAAGGVVHPGDTDLTLFLFRRGWWDLPKGKIDPGETRQAAALREVREETGLRELSLEGALPTTFHTYRTGKGKRVLKPTYWFRMRTDQLELTPQAEEDIERAEWLTGETVLASGEPLYANLRALLRSI